MPEIVSTPNALVQTTNGKRFYVYSGIVNVDNTETSLVDINNIGERDIKLHINPCLTNDSSDEMTMKVKVNGIIIYQSIYAATKAIEAPLPIILIIPANTSLDITFDASDASVHPVGVACHGKYI